MAGWLTAVESSLSLGPACSHGVLLDLQLATTLLYQHILKFLTFCAYLEQIIAQNV